MSSEFDTHWEESFDRHASESSSTPKWSFALRHLQLGTLVGGQQIPAQEGQLRQSLVSRLESRGQ